MKNIIIVLLILISILLIILFTICDLKLIRTLIISTILFLIIKMVSVNNNYNTFSDNYNTFSDNYNTFSDNYNTFSDNYITGGKENKLYIPKVKTYSLNIRDFKNNKILESINKEAIYTLTSSKPYYVSHIHEDHIKADNFTRIIDDSSNRLKYNRRFLSYKKQLHWGQLKLMLTEVEFISLSLKRYRDSGSLLPIYLVYAGAAPGHHIEYLSSLFPSVYFELYDPNDFAIKDNDKITTHVQFFTNIDAEHWADQQSSKYVVFASDIRTEPATEENVQKNMDMQLEWWKLMNPELAMFKFRLPWKEGQTKYVKGDIYIQPYPGPTSTETRLIVKKDADMINYDNIKYEEQLFYHNRRMREIKYSTVLGDNLSIEIEGIDNCYDCASFVHILENYLDVTDFKGDHKEEILRLVKELQNNIMFGKYNIYTKTIDHINDRLEALSRFCIYECKNKCNICTLKKINRKYGVSKATDNNYNKYIAEIPVSK